MIKILKSIFGAKEPEPAPANPEPIVATFERYDPALMTDAEVIRQINKMALLTDNEPTKAILLHTAFVLGEDEKGKSDYFTLIEPYLREKLKAKYENAMERNFEAMGKIVEKLKATLPKNG